MNLNYATKIFYYQNYEVSSSDKCLQDVLICKLLLEYGDIEYETVYVSENQRKDLIVWDSV